MNLEDVNEQYHSKSKIHKRIITSKNFTYRILISIIDRYIWSGEKIVDFGSGVGTLDFYLAARGNKVTGVDFSEIAINMAKLNSRALGVEKNVRYFRRDLPVSKISGKYDSVLMTEVIEHLPDEKIVLKGVNKVLKKGGILIISTRSSNAPLNKIGLTKSHDRNVGHLHRYTLPRLEKFVIKAGFCVIEKGETEGFIRDFLFSFPKIGSQVVRIANRFENFSDFLTLIDSIFLEIFGEAQIYLVAKKC